MLEIGPGIGTLTEELARRASRVIAVELDGALVQVLRDRLPPDRVLVVEGDVLALDLPSLLGEASPIKVVANLPYYITSPIVFRFLEWKGWEMMVIMVQGEVAERLVARPGTKAYGALSVAVALQARAEILFKVSRQVFYPTPGRFSGCPPPSTTRPGGGPARSFPVNSSRLWPAAQDPGQCPSCGSVEPFKQRRDGKLPPWRRD